MAIWDGIIKQFRRANRIGLISNPWYLPPERDIRGFLSAYGSIYSLFGIANRIATAMSEVRWRLYRGSERSERSQIADHPILALLDFANEFQTGQEIMELHSICSDCAGKVFWYLPRNKLGVPGEIWILPPTQVKIVPSKDFIAGYVYSSGSEQIPLDKSEVIYFPMPDPLNPYGGIGYAQAAAVELDSESYSGKWNRNFFFNSARADAVLEFEGTLTEEQFERLKEQWEKRHGGLGRAHRIAILEGGAKYKQTQIMPKDMDFAQLRKQTRENLLFTFGMPLSVMGISEDVNRANAEAGDYTFARWLIRPRLTRIKNKLNEQLLPMFKGTENLELDFDEVVPETIEQKMQLSESGVRSGILSINEGRKLLGFDSIPAGDQLLIPLNLIPTKVKIWSGQTSQKLIMSEDQKEMNWRLYVAKTERQEIAFKRALEYLFDKQADGVIERLKDAVKPDDALFDEKEEIDTFQKRLRAVIELVFTDASEEALKQEFPLDAAALEWIAKRSLGLAKGLNETTIEKLRITLAEGFEQGESIPKLTRRIRDFYSEQQKWRAPLTARTEVIAASNEGALWRYEHEGLDKAEFYTALDERTCEDCEAYHGNIYPIGECHGMIPVHPNCRCTFTPIVE